MDYEKIGLFIQNRRKELKMTQKELALKLNVTDKAVSKWERGLGCPDVSLLGELSEALEVGIGEILNGEFNETLKDNSEFIKNAVDYSKNITEKNMTENIKKILYMVLILITFYMSFMGIKQFIYLSGGISFRSSIYDNAYKEYLKLKSNADIIRKKGYLVYKTDNYSTDFSESLDYLILQLEKSKLLSVNTVEIKNTELLNAKFLSQQVKNINIMSLTYLKHVDNINEKYYDLATDASLFNSEEYYVVDSSGKPEWDTLFNYNDDILYYYSAKLYNYDKIMDNKINLDNYYRELELLLVKLNKTLDLVIEVGDNNE